MVKAYFPTLTFTLTFILTTCWAKLVGTFDDSITQRQLINNAQLVTDLVNLV